MKRFFWTCGAILATISSVFSGGAVWSQTTMLLDFGVGMAINDSFIVESGEINKVNYLVNDGEGNANGTTGFWTGPNVALSDDWDVELRTLGFDFDRNGAINFADMSFLAAQVVPLVDHIVEPFDVNVEIAVSHSIRDDQDPTVSIGWTMNNYTDAAYALIVESLTSAEPGEPPVQQLARGAAAQDTCMNKQTTQTNSR